MTDEQIKAFWTTHLEHQSLLNEPHRIVTMGQVRNFTRDILNYSNPDESARIKHLALEHMMDTYHSKSPFLETGMALITTFLDAGIPFASVPFDAEHEEVL